MKHRIAAGFATMALTLASASAAQTSGDDAATLADLQCLAVVSILGGQAEKGSVMEMGAAASMMFYLGRLEGRSPRVNWLERFKTFLLSNDIECELETEAERCGREMIEKGQALEQFGAEMQRLSDKMS